MRRPSGCRSAVGYLANHSPVKVAFPIPSESTGRPRPVSFQEDSMCIDFGSIQGTDNRTLAASASPFRRQRE